MPKRKRDDLDDEKDDDADNHSSRVERKASKTAATAGAGAPVEKRTVIPFEPSECKNKIRRKCRAQLYSFCYCTNPHCAPISVSFFAGEELNRKKKQAKKKEKKAKKKETQQMIEELGEDVSSCQHSRLISRLRL